MVPIRPSGVSLVAQLATDSCQHTGELSPQSFLTAEEHKAKGRQVTADGHTPGRAMDHIVRFWRV